MEIFIMTNKILGFCLSVSFLSLSFTDVSVQVANQSNQLLARCPCKDQPKKEKEVPKEKEKTNDKKLTA